MTRRIAALLLAASVAACSGSSSPEPAKPTPVVTERDELEATRPGSPLRSERTTRVRPAGRRGRTPYRLEASALSARYGEGLLVHACAARPVSGRFRLTTTEPAREPARSEGTFGLDRDDRAWVARERPRVAPADCPVATLVVDATFMMEGDGVPLDPGARIAIDVWFDRPKDLAEVVFVVEQQAVRRDMTPERWAVYRQADRAWTERYLAYLHREAAARRVR